MRSIYRRASRHCHDPNDLWLETLAFAEGRLLSIHPFADFNGRVTPVFIDLLTRVLKLPDVGPMELSLSARYEPSPEEDRMSVKGNRR